MIRYSLFVLTILASAATAFAAIQPASVLETRNVTVIEKNEFWHVVNELTVEQCAKEDCSDTPQG
jgi:hypothetical protein